MSKATPKNEAEFRRHVRKYAEENGWDVHFEIDSRFKHDSGFPDLVIGRLPGPFPPSSRDRRLVLFRELKMPGKYLSARQDDWRRILEGAGMDYAVWRPADWPAIEEALR